MAFVQVTRPGNRLPTTQEMISKGLDDIVAGYAHLESKDIEKKKLSREVAQKNLDNRIAISKLHNDWVKETGEQIPFEDFAKRYGYTDYKESTEEGPSIFKRAYNYFNEPKDEAVTTVDPTEKTDYRLPRLTLENSGGIATLLNQSKTPSSYASRLMAPDISINEYNTQQQPSSAISSLLSGQYPTIKPIKKQLEEEKLTYLKNKNSNVGKDKDIKDINTKIKGVRLSIYNQQLKDLIERNNKEREENTFKALPTENQVAIKKIQDGSAGILKIKNILDAEIGNLTDKNLDIDQKIAAGKNILKSLNSLSVASPDAVSAEEVDRLAGFLKFHIFPNLTEPGPVFGRDLNAFIQQVGLKSSAVEKAILANDQIIDSLKQGKTIYDSISKTGLNANVQKAVNINNKQTGMTPQQKLQRKQFLKQKATI
jgi:hypothetical protein